MLMKQVLRFLMTKNRYISLLILAFSFSVAVYLFVPKTEQIYNELPAIVIEKSSEHVTTTQITIAGQLERRGITRKPLSYTGKYQIEALPYTEDIQGFGGKFDFMYDDKLGCYSAVCGYKSGSHDLRFAHMYTDKELSDIVYFDDAYIVIAPAVTFEDGREICNKLNLSFIFG